MRFHVDPTYKMHIRTALLIALSAAFATLFGALLYNMERVKTLTEMQRGFTAETARLSSSIDRRFAALALRSDANLEAVEERLREISSAQSEINSSSQATGSRAPFDISDRASAVVEVICIDNNNRQDYYSGSGTVVDPSGLIVTNHHLFVSSDGSLIRHCGIGFTANINEPPSIEYVASAVAVQEQNDLVLLRITERLDEEPLPDSFPSVSLVGATVSSERLGIGDPIFIGGYPGIGADTFTFTQGVVSGRVGEELIKTSALIDSGASGGAAFDAKGNYVGVPTAAVRGEIGGSLGYLVGANMVDSFVSAYAEAVGE